MRVPLHVVLRVEMPREIAWPREDAFAERTHAGPLFLLGDLLGAGVVSAPGTDEGDDAAELATVDADAAGVEPAVAAVALDEVSLREGGLETATVEETCVRERKETCLRDTAPRGPAATR